MDTIKFTILPDGTIKMETDKVSMANHSNGEGFLRACVAMAGGKADRKHKHGGIMHSHTHGEGEHEHA